MIEIDFNYYERRNKIIPLGIQNEDQVRAVVVDMTALISILGTRSSCKLYYRHDGGAAHEITGTVTDNVASFPITNTETTNSGKGWIQFIFYPTSPSGSQYRSRALETTILR